MASAAGMRMRQPLRGIFPLTDLARFHTYIPGWLSRVANAVASVDTYLRLQGVGEVMIAIGLLGWFLLVCASGINAAYGRNDAHSALCWSRCGTVSQHRPSGAALSLLISSYQDMGRQATLMCSFLVLLRNRGALRHQHNAAHAAWRCLHGGTRQVRSRDRRTRQKIHYTAHSLWSAAHDWRHRGLALPDRGSCAFEAVRNVMPFCPSPHQGIVEGTITLAQVRGKQTAVHRPQPRPQKRQQPATSWSTP